ncbi:hypothetical protein N798_00260 [Knoellia flava TL1]|uniref:Uncharacterized protein n=2 Tax=Knoellia flava TaxID=913969 RepID=A0A8H9KSV7_9MICO|nr:hypothetical protein [Knoellia flava]KGN36016.1 hypothetical protein N798_00260 [Knoellia flava TL1]GGB81364.1 hypothetical protein GCM10011314_21210 [Knoellia flava]
MISRAAEWEASLSGAFAILMHEPPAKRRKTPPADLIKLFKNNAYRWPHLEARILKMCAAAGGEDGAIEWRNWMVHATATPAWSGERAFLHKAEKKQEGTAQRIITVDQTQRLAAMFRWLTDILARILSDMHPDGRPVVCADPLGPPPPSARN